MEGLTIYQKGFCQIVQLNDGGHSKPPWKIKKSLTQICIKDGNTIRGTTLLHQFLTKPASERANTRLRVHGRTRHDLKTSATQLRDHVRQTPPRSFPPTGALCAVPVWLLFSSSSLQCSLLIMAVVYSLFFRMSTVFFKK